MTTLNGVVGTKRGYQGIGQRGRASFAPLRCVNCCRRQRTTSNALEEWTRQITLKETRFCWTVFAFHSETMSRPKSTLLKLIMKGIFRRMILKTKLPWFMRPISDYVRLKMICNNPAKMIRGGWLIFNNVAKKVFKSTERRAVPSFIQNYRVPMRISRFTNPSRRSYCEHQFCVFNSFVCS